MSRALLDGHLAVLDLVPLGIFVVSPTYDVIFWNRCIADWADKPADSVVGRPLVDIFPGMLEPGRRARMEQVFSGGAPAIFSSDLHPDMLPLTLRNGDWRAQHTTVSALAESEDGLFDALVVVRDVTELATQVKQLRDAQLLRAKVEQAQRLEGLGLLAGGIAHDFNNVLSALLLSADLAIDGLPLGSPVMPHLLEIQNSALHGTRLAKRMLSYAGRSTLVESDIELNGVVRDTIRLVRSSVSDGIALDVSLVDEDAVATADPTQVRQIVMNLIINGAEAIGEEGGAISVRTRVEETVAESMAPYLVTTTVPPGPVAVIEVADTGPGMDAGTRDRIFDPFFTTKLAGRGLGLAAVLSIVQRHKGALAVESSPGQGTRFTIFLPRVAAPKSLPPPAAEGSVAVGGSDRTVLIVDDNAHVRRSVRRAIRRLGFSTLEAENGELGLEKFMAHQESISIVVLDIVMPVMNGVEALRRIREIRPEVPALFISGYSELELPEQTAGLGHIDFLKKPFDVSELMGAIEKLARLENGRGSGRRRRVSPTGLPTGLDKARAPGPRSDAPAPRARAQVRRSAERERILAVQVRLEVGFILGAADPVRDALESGGYPRQDDRADGRRRNAESGSSAQATPKASHADISPRRAEDADASVFNVVRHAPEYRCSPAGL